MIILVRIYANFAALHSCINSPKHYHPVISSVIIFKESRTFKMDEELRISQPDDSKFMVVFWGIWSLFCIFNVFVMNYSIVPLFFLVFGSVYFPFHLYKVRVIYFDRERTAISIKGNDLVEVNLSNIEQVKKSSAFQGYYTIVFKKRTKIGKFVSFAPRKEGRFKKYKGFVDFVACVKNQDQ